MGRQGLHQVKKSSVGIMIFAWNVKGYRNSFYCSNSNGRLNRDERLNRENISPLQTWADDLVAADVGDAEGLNTTTKVSKASVV